MGKKSKKRYTKHLVPGTQYVLNKSISGIPSPMPELQLPGWPATSLTGPGRGGAHGGGLLQEYHEGKQPWFRPFLKDTIQLEMKNQL